MLHHLIYVSRSVEHFDDTSLLILLNKARQRNRQQGISGLLLYDDKTFIQYIEGPASSLNELMGTITRDRRHTVMVYLLREPSEEGRLFPDWSMGYNHMRVMNRIGIPGLQENGFEDVKYHLEKQTDSLAAAMLTKLIEANSFS